MPEIQTEIHIPAPPSEVYAVLLDLASWPRWNPSVARIEGAARIGEKLRLHLALRPGKRPLPVAATITRLGPELGIEWRGGFPGVPALLDIHHYFLIEPEGEGTRFIHGERFEGLLARALWRSIEPRVRPNYARTNEGLRRALAAR